MDVRKIRVTAADGVELGATRFRSVTAAPATVVVASAMGVHQAYYRRFATWLAGQGFDVLTFDYRGIGESRPESLRGFEASVRSWGQLDLPCALAHARKAGHPVYLLGHSVGGQLLGLLPYRDDPDAVYLVGSQAGDVRSSYPWSSQLTMGLGIAVLLPASAHLLGYTPGFVLGSEDLPRGVALEWARWCRTKGYHLAAVPGVRERFASFSNPISMTSFSDDWYAPSAAVDVLQQAFTGAEVRRRHLEPKDLGAKRIGHFGFFREASPRSLWEDASQWFADLVPNGVSGAGEGEGVVRRLVAPQPAQLDRRELERDAS